MIGSSSEHEVVKKKGKSRVVPPAQGKRRTNPKRTCGMKRNAADMGGSSSKQTAKKDCKVAAAPNAAKLDSTWSMMKISKRQYEALRWDIK